MTLSGNSKLAGVMGWPVKHSRSPLLHGHWLDRHNIDGAYVPLAVAPEHFASALTALPQLGFRGTNITVPHKQSALELLTEIGEVDDVARRIGAVNTVVVGDDGRMHGSNTDAFGFMENIRVNAPDWQADAGPVVLLGAGGAARAIIVALLDAGVPEIRLANRGRDRADGLATEFGAKINVADWEQRADILADANGLVNSTSLGMEGQPSLGMDLASLGENSLVTDIVYAPLVTELLLNARRMPEKACQIVDGLGMLLHQARPGFSAWFGVEPTVDDDLRQAVLRDLGASDK
ncbi:MAG: shikimate dehydrogenase [Alphaproteobacteria bacterium]|nr:shikimate dehydrogenase [Alphaproteobacteria bacterium]